MGLGQGPASGSGGMVGVVQRRRILDRQHHRMLSHPRHARFAQGGSQGFGSDRLARQNRYAAVISAWVLNTCGIEPSGSSAILQTMCCARAVRRTSPTSRASSSWLAQPTMALITSSMSILVAKLRTSFVYIANHLAAPHPHHKMCVMHRAEACRAVPWNVRAGTARQRPQHPTPNTLQPRQLCEARRLHLLEERGLLPRPSARGAAGERDPGPGPASSSRLSGTPARRPAARCR